MPAVSTCALSAIQRRESVAGVVGAGAVRIASASDAPVRSRWTEFGSPTLACTSVRLSSSSGASVSAGAFASAVVFTTSTVPPPEMKFSRLKPIVAFAWNVSRAFIWSENAGTPWTPASACQSSFGSVVGAPVAVVTWFTCTEPTLRSSVSTDGSIPTRLAATPVASSPR